MAAQNGFAYSALGALTNGRNNMSGQANPALGALTNGMNNMSGQANPPLDPETSGTNEEAISNLTTAFLPLSSGIDVTTLVLLEEIGAFPEVYIMRAYKTTPTTGFVYWFSYDDPDLTGALSGYPVVDLADIVIIREPCLP